MLRQIQDICNLSFVFFDIFLDAGYNNNGNNNEDNSQPFHVFQMGAFVLYSRSTILCRFIIRLL